MVPFWCPACMRVVAQALERSVVWCRCGVRCIQVKQQAVLPRVPRLRGPVRARGNVATARNVQST